mmetsp:Transcript_82419/g.267018  ORF Transcript_82419/g.267018 Transcript_82419/m.267018 type:complete len:171 (-) Transcript_82419:122-634(-)
MPFYGLFMKAELENVEKITCPEDIVWTLDVRHSAGTDVREKITINAQEEFEIPNSKGTANFMVKFEGAKQFATMSILVPTRKNEVKSLKGAELGVFTPETAATVPLAIFDCRGLEPVKCHPVANFTVVSTGEAVFEAADFSDPDGWSEYDEKADLSLTVSGIEFEFRIVK